ncbi:MAG TPA: carbohydrate kinase family protein [Myxococcales bacterium]|nr:carbohydrate kinase family protein [Myxococcales bacterium]
MSVLVTGSVAIDHIMVFEDLFKNHILPDQIHRLNVAFLVPSLEKRWGGTGANIAFNLRLLGEDPALLATVGNDLGAYAQWLDDHGVRRDYLRVLDNAFTAQCFITTDRNSNQLIVFHPGAMERAHEASLADVREEISMGIVSPNGKQAMIEYTAELKSRQIPCVIDPGQQLPTFEGDELLGLIEGASILVVNDYEWLLTQEKTGMDEDAIAERVGALVVTRGAEGSMVRRGGVAVPFEIESDRSEIASVKAQRVTDPTGCGDAYRSGLLYALARGLSLETGCRLGSLMGALKVAEAGPQSIALDREAIAARFEVEFGSKLA